MIKARFERGAGGLPVGVYSAVIEDIYEMEKEWPSSEGPVCGVEWAFQVEMENGQKRRQTKWCSKSLGLKSNLRKFIAGVAGSALTKEVLADDDKISDLLNAQIGREVILTISQSEKGTGTGVSAIASVPTKGGSKKIVSEIKAAADDDIPF